MTSRRSVLHFPSPIKWSSARVGAAACETWAANKIRQGRLEWRATGHRPAWLAPEDDKDSPSPPLGLQARYRISLLARRRP